MLRRHWAVVLGCIAGLPTTAQLLMGRWRLAPDSTLPWPLRAPTLRWLVLLCAACALVESVLELRRSRYSLHVARFSAFMLAALIPALQPALAPSHLSPLATAYLLLFLLFIVLCAIDIDPLYGIPEAVLSALMQWEILLLMFSAWVMSSVAALVGAR